MNMMVMCTKVIAFEWLSRTRGQNIVEELQKQKMIINNWKTPRLKRGLIDQKKEEWKGIGKNTLQGGGSIDQDEENNWWGSEETWCQKH